MASSGPLYPATVATVSRSNAFTWVNPNNVKVDDAAIATATNSFATFQSHFMDCTAFGFSIPAGATIDGVVFETEGANNGFNYMYYQHVQIIKAGTAGGTTYGGVSDQMPSLNAYAIKSYGSSSNLWGNTLSDSDVNNSGFGVRFAVATSNTKSTRTAQIDFIRLTVYYTTAGGSFSQSCNEAITVVDTVAKTPARSLAETAVVTDSLIYTALLSGLAEYYKLEDLTGSFAGYTLTNSGGVTFGSPAKLINAAQFGASNSANRLYRAPSMFSYSDLASPWTVSMWLNPASLASNNRAMRYIVNNGTLERNWIVDINTSGKVIFNTFDTSGRTVTGTTTLSTGTYYHVVVQYDGSAMKLFVNAASEGTPISFSWSGFARNTFSCLCIGAEQLTTGGGASDYFKGSIDEVGFWKRALTQMEIDALYKGGAGFQYPFTGGLFITLTEILVVVDSMTKSLSRSLSEIITVVGNITSRTLGRSLTETITIVGNVTRTASRSLVEIISIVDTARAYISAKTINEIVTVVDTLVKTAARTRLFTETVTVVDTFIKATVRSLNEIVAIVDSVAAKITGRMLNETIVVVDRIAKTAGRSFNEVIAIVDAISTKITGKSLLEVITVVDSIAKNAAKVRTFNEVVTAVDTFAKTIGRSLVETVTVVGNAVVKVTAKTLTEAITVVDRLAKISIRSLFETLIVVDILVKNPAKAITNVVVVVDTFARSLTTTRFFTEAIAVADIVAKTPARFILNSIAVVDTVATQIFTGKMLNETIVVVDSFFRTMSRFLAETITVVGSAALSTAKIINANEIVMVLDSLAKSIARSLTDRIAVVDVLQKTFVRSLTDRIAVVDSFLRTITKALVERVAVADILTRIIARAFAERVAVVDTVIKNASRSLIERIAVSDSFETLRAYGRSFTETLSILDSFITNFKGYYRKGVTILKSLSSALPSVLKSKNSDRTTLRTKPKDPTILK